jgi:hypothetical protein
MWFDLMPYSELHFDRFAVVETAMTLHAELMLLCARIGYSPPVC